MNMSDANHYHSHHRDLLLTALNVQLPEFCEKLKMNIGTGRTAGSLRFPNRSALGLCGPGKMLKVGDPGTVCRIRGQKDTTKDIPAFQSHGESREGSLQGWGNAKPKSGFGCVED